MLAAVEGQEKAELLAAAEVAKSVRGPLAAAGFVRHHLRGAHEGEVDWVAAHEEMGERTAVLVYSECEVSAGLDALTGAAGARGRLRYDPEAGRYRPV